MADVKNVPEHLRHHAEAMPADLVSRMTDEELQFRCKHVHDLMADADAMPNPALHRQLVRHAHKVRDAMPHYEYRDEMKRLEAGHANATTAGMTEIQAAYGAAVRRLESEHPQVPKVGHFLDNTVGRPPAEESAAEDTKGADSMLYKRVRAAAVVQAELKKYQEKLTEDTERLRAEIAEFKEAIKTGRSTPLETSRALTKAEELEAKAAHYERQADSILDRDLSRWYRQQACEAKEAAIRLKRGSE